MALLEKSVSTLYLRVLLLLLAAAPMVKLQGVAALQDDLDLTGCSVAMSSYIWNLNGLKKNSL